MQSVIDQALERFQRELQAYLILTGPYPKEQTIEAMVQELKNELKTKTSPINP